MYKSAINFYFGKNKSDEVTMREVLFSSSMCFNILKLQ